MKTYFLSWETSNKRGHAIYDFPDNMTAREALKEMLESSEMSVPDSVGPISAINFHLVEQSKEQP